jgi:hypothetical protein
MWFDRKYRDIKAIAAQFKVKNIEIPAARVGYTITPELLAYVRGGAAWTSASGAAIIPGGLADESTNFGLTGYSAGTGLEWMFALEWPVFGEYDFMDFERRTLILSLQDQAGLVWCCRSVADTPRQVENADGDCRR